VVLICRNLCLCRRSLRSNVGGIHSKKLYRATLTATTKNYGQITLNIKPRLFSKKVRGLSVFRNFCICSAKLCDTHTMGILSQLRASTNFCTKFGCFLACRTGAVIQETEKTLTNSHTTTQKRTNHGSRNAKKHPNFHMHGTIFKI